MNTMAEAGRWECLTYLLDGSLLHHAVPDPKPRELAGVDLVGVRERLGACLGRHLLPEEAISAHGPGRLGRQRIGGLCE